MNKDDLDDGNSLFFNVNDEFLFSYTIQVTFNNRIILIVLIAKLLFILFIFLLGPNYDKLSSLREDILLSYCQSQSSTCRHFLNAWLKVYNLEPINL